jgi:hypothetical protein
VRGSAASALAVALVVVVIAIIYAVRGHNDDDPTVRASSPPSTTASATPTESQTPTPSATPTSTGTVTPPPPATTPPPAIVPGSRGAIYVYTAPGAGADLNAAVTKLKAAGYSIKKTNAVGLNPSRTTVYYGKGEADEAAAMVALNIGVQAAAPRPAGYADPTTLFVVVTRTFS